MRTVTLSKWLLVNFVSICDIQILGAKLYYHRNTSSWEMKTIYHNFLHSK